MPCFLDIFSLDLKFLAQPEGHKNREEMLRLIRRRPFKAVFQVMRVAVFYRNGQKQFKIIALHLKSTLATPPLYNGAYPEKLWTAFPGNPVGVSKTSLYLLFVKPDQKTSKDSTSLKRTYFFDNFRQKILQKS